MTPLPTGSGILPGRAECNSAIQLNAAEPQPKERGCVEDQPQHPGKSDALRLVEGDTAALRKIVAAHDDLG